MFNQRKQRAIKTLSLPIAPTIPLTKLNNGKKNLKFFREYTVRNNIQDIIFFLSDQRRD